MFILRLSHIFQPSNKSMYPPLIPFLINNLFFYFIENVEVMNDRTLIPSSPNLQNRPINASAISHIFLIKMELVFHAKSS